MGNVEWKGARSEGAVYGISRGYGEAEEGRGEKALERVRTRELG